MSGVVLELTRVRAEDEAAFAKLIAMYDAAFPVSERKTVAVLRAALAGEASHFLLAREAGRTVGFAIVWVLGGGEVAMLEYMAVSPEARGRGVGRRLVGAIREAVGAEVLVLEVESDRELSEDREVRVRRKRFYRSLGASEVEGLRWLMPPQSEAVPPAMELMVFGVDGAIAKERVREWVTGIYVEVYGQGADDARIEGMMQELGQVVRLE